MTPEAVGNAIAFLQELPEKPKEDLSLKAAVEQMQQSIRETLSKGYSYDDVAQMLSEKGISISALTLKNYVPSGKRQASKTRGKRTKKSAEAAATTSVAPATIASPEPAPEEGAEPTPATKPRRGRKPATKASAEGEPKPKSTRGRKPATANQEAGTTTTRKRRQAKAQAS